MPHEPKPQAEYRQVTYRVLFDSPAMARRLAAVAGACRFVWNRMLDRQQQLLEDARLNGATPPAPTFFALGREFTRLRRDTPWLQEMPCASVRYALKYQADAWKQFLEGKAGHPHSYELPDVKPEGVALQPPPLRCPLQVCQLSSIRSSAAHAKQKFFSK